MTDNERRRNHYDVTNRVNVADPRAVEAAIQPLMHACGGVDALPALTEAFQQFSALYAGTLPGFYGCDTRYHDTQHSLDCALTCARLLDGHARSAPRSERLSGRQAVIAVIVALFHDAGYVRHDNDAASNGAAYTLTHVSRSADFLRTLLPALGFRAEAAMAAHIVHFTGYEIAIEALRVADPAYRRMGQIIGTADLLAQTADRCYLEKCRDFLFPEFTCCGLAGPARTTGPTPVYDSVESLLTTTVEFNQRLWDERLASAFDHAYRLEAAHFDGATPYRDAIQRNLRRIAALIPSGDFHRLGRRPRAITRDVLRASLARPLGN